MSTDEQRKPYIRFRRMCEGIMPGFAYDERLTRPFDKAEHAAACAREAEQRAREQAAEDARIADLVARGVKPCPCCGEYCQACGSGDA